MERARAINLPAAVIWLAAAFAAVHGIRHLLAPAQDQWALLTFAFIPARYGEVGADLPGGFGARIWSPVSYAFLHADVIHLLVNVIWMASFGAPLARRFGNPRFLLLSLIAAIAGAGLHFVIHSDDPALVIGASGAVSGMMAGTARFAFAPGGPLAGSRSTASFRVPAESLLGVLANGRALAFILTWFAINLVFGLVGGMAVGASGPIAWEAHIGGFLAGFLLFPLLDPVVRLDSD